MEDLFPRVFWLMVADRQKSGQRYGQAVFNTAHFLYYEEARRLTGSLFDPFYGDDKVPAFLERLADLLTR